MGPRKASTTAHVCALVALAILLPFTSPNPVGLAQSEVTPLVRWRGLLDRVSAPPTGSSGDAQFGRKALSGDGRFAVFASNAFDLVPGEYANGWHVYLRDRTTRTTTRLSVAFDGNEGYGLSDMAAVSSDGRHVAYASSTSNIVPGDTNNVWDIFVRDVDAARTVRVSVASDGTQGDRDSYWPVISANGRFVAFISAATTLVSEFTPNHYQAYLHDRDSDGNGTLDEPDGTTTTRVSVSSNGTPADASVPHVSVSADGRFVSFETSATNLDPVGNPDGGHHIYMRDRQTGETWLVDRSVTGGPSTSGVDVRNSDMSEDGRFVTYVSFSPDIVPRYADWSSHVFRYDRLGGAGMNTAVVTALPDGSFADGSSYSTSISRDGRYVAFTTSAANLASPAPGPGAGALLVRDMLEGGFTRVDLLGDDTPLDDAFPYSPSISPDGSAVAFISDAGNDLTDGYAYGYDAFVATAFSVSVTSASWTKEGGAASIDVNTLPVNGWSATTTDDWITLTDGYAVTAGPGRVHYVVAPNTSGIVRHGTIRVGSTIIAIHQAGDGDTTPPVITPIVTGTLHPSGFYTSDIVVEWTVTDPDSEIVQTGNGCVRTTFTSDFLYGNPTCEATSHGGTTTVSVPLRRDTTAPSISISYPLPTIYPQGAAIVPHYSCTEGEGYAGVAGCGIVSGSSPVDTSPGRHLLTVMAIDRAGNQATKSVEYLVGTDACVMPSLPAEQHLKGWWRFDGDYRDTARNLLAVPMGGPGYFEQGVAGQAWMNVSSQNHLEATDGSQLLAGPGLTVAAWVKPFGQMGESGTIVSKPAQYRIARYPDGTLRWAFNETTGFTWVNTGVVIPANIWTHVAVTYKDGLVESYVNGALVHSTHLSGTLRTTGDPTAPFTIGGQRSVTAMFFGGLDDVLIFNDALSRSDIESIAVAGSGSLCVPKASRLFVDAPPTLSYGSELTVSAQLTDDFGNRLPNRPVVFRSYVGPAGFMWETSALTRADGTATVKLQASTAAALGDYPRAITVAFPGDASYQPSSSERAITLVAGTPQVTWTAPGSIVYGTALGALQLKATASVAGTFAYMPAAGTVLNAGTHTLTATFTPSDLTHWAPTTRTTTIVVTRAAPVVTAVGGTFTYDKQPHSGSGTAVGVFGEELSPVQLTYNGGSATPPVSGGVHAVRASYAGSQNYAAGESVSVPLTINRAVPAIEISTSPIFYSGSPRQASVTVRGVDGDELNPYSVLYNGESAQPIDAGTYAVQVRYDGDANYEPAIADGAIVIDRTTPIMSIGAEARTYDGQPHGGSAAVVGVKNELLTPIIITYDGSTAEPVNAGVYTMEARYEGSANYAPISKTVTLTIAKAVPHVTWANPQSLTYGTALDGAQLNAAANVPGAFTYSPAPGTVLPAGSHRIDAVFVPSDTRNYAEVARSVSVYVNKAAPVLSWPAPADISYGTALGPAQLSATTNVEGSFTYSPAEGTVLDAGADQPLSVVFTPDDSANYDSATGETAITVLRAPAVITWPAPAPMTYGAPLSASQLGATASVPGTFTYAPAAGALLDAGSHTLSVTFTPADGARYTGGSFSVPLTVQPAALTIVANDSTKPFGAPLPPFSVMAAGLVNGDSLASLSGTLTFSTGATAASPVGTYVVTPQGLTASNYTISFAAGSLTVVRATTVTALVTTPGRSGINQPVTFAASIAVAAPGAGIPKGVIQFFDGGSLLGSSPLVDGSASLTTNGLAAGTHNVSATYSGDAGFAPSTGAATHTVNSFSSSSTTTLSSSANPSTSGQSVSFTATVTSPAGGISGVVEFYDGGTSLGTAALVGGSARIITAALGAGGHAITARYLGNGTLPPSLSAALAQTVQEQGDKTRGSATALAVSPGASPLGEEVTLTATVSGSQGPHRQAPAGSVLFMVNGTVIGEAATVATDSSMASAVFRTSGLARGTHAVTVVYLGDGTYRASTATATLTVN